MLLGSFLVVSSKPQRYKWLNDLVVKNVHIVLLFGPRFALFLWGGAGAVEARRHAFFNLRETDDHRNFRLDESTQ